MRSNFTLGLAALALGFGVAGASAASFDLDQVAPNAAAQAGRVPDESFGHFGAGFAAIKSHKGGGPQSSLASGLSAGAFNPDALARPDEGHPWRDGLAALTPVSPGVTPNGAAARQAMALPPGMSAPTTGLAALKTSAGEHGGAFIELPSEGYSGRGQVQRPEGGNWSDQGLSSLRSDTIGTVPGNLLGPASK